MELPAIAVSADAGIVHAYPFDPTHGYSLAQLLAVPAPEPPKDFAEFWRARYERALALAPRPKLRDTGADAGPWRVFDLSYTSTDATRIKGWMLLPASGVPRRAFVVGHGYSGRTGPDFNLPFHDAALVFPCSRGLGRSRHPAISSDPQWHVLHDIQDRDRYVIGGCMEDLWLAVSALLRLRPEVEGHVGYLGISFGGGIGALALPWEARVRRAHLNVPTFGQHPLRLELESVGSAAGVQRFAAKNPEIRETLAYYDAATAARFFQIPVHCACARFDPAVAPAGQFAIYNALPGERRLFTLAAGHHDHPGAADEERDLLRNLDEFFRDL